MMKSTTISCLALFSVIVPVWSTFGQGQLSSSDQKLHDTNADVRVEAAEHLFDGIAKPPVGSSFGQSSNDVLPLLGEALQDSEPKVRNYAAAGFALLATSTMPKLHPPGPGVPDIRGYQPLQSLLRHAIDDPDVGVRKNALTAYLLCYPIQAELQDALVDRFENERGNVVLQQMIIAALINDGTPTDKANTLLMRLIDEPGSSYKIAQAVTVASTPPNNLLPKLANQLNIVDTPSKRTLFSHAISKYGPQAKPYLAQMETAKNKESDQTAKQAMQKDLDAIDSPK